VVHKPTPQLLAWADVIRIVATLLVVLLHTFKITALDTLQDSTSLYMVTFASISVPIFIMLSGALLLPKMETWRTFFLKRVNRIVVPWVTWTIVVFLVFHADTASFSWQTLSLLSNTFTGSFTYLPLIFCLYLLIPTLRVIVQHSQVSHIAYLISLWFLAVSVLPFVRNTMAFPLSIDNGLVTQTVRFSGYLLTGWLLSQVKILKRPTFFVLVCVLLGLIFWTTRYMQKGETIDFTYSSYTSPWIVASSTIAFVLLVNAVPSFEVMSFTIRKIVRLLSKVSFGVFLIHNAVIASVRPVILSLQLEPLFNNIVFWLAVSAVCFGIIALLYQLKPIRRFVT
jgi:surface polysaccharide O-acyltransferase-like enzyme